EVCVDDRQEVLEVGIRQARIVASLIARQGVDRDEALSEAYLAMVQAMREFDPSRGACSTWFYRMIRWRMIDRLRAIRGRHTPRDVPTVSLASLESEPVEASYHDDGPDQVDQADLLEYVSSRGPTSRRLVRMAV